MRTMKTILAALDALEQGSLELCCARSLYPRSSFEAAGLAYGDYCEVAWEDDGDFTVLKLAVRQRYRMQAREVLGGLLNFLLLHAAEYLQGDQDS